MEYILASVGIFLFILGTIFGAAMAERRKDNSQVSNNFVYKEAKKDKNVL